jgi:hypothetical protein
MNLNSKGPIDSCGVTDAGKGKPIAESAD